MRKLFKKNIGTKDRLIRLSIAIALLVLAYLTQSWIPLPVALFILFEAFMSWCVFYHLIGKSSCPIDKKKPKKE